MVSIVSHSIEILFLLPKNMIDIKPATKKDLHIISSLAQEIWFATYRDYLSEEQIVFMLENIYSEKSLSEQQQEGHQFLLVQENTKPKGFASFSETANSYIFKIHKIYLHPDFQGKGAGRKMIDYISNEVSSRGGTTLELNVNRDNPAKKFYEKTGFVVIKSVDIPYYHFVLNDFIMHKYL